MCTNENAASPIDWRHFSSIIRLHGKKWNWCEEKYKIKQRQGKRPGVVAKRTTKGDLTLMVEKSLSRVEVVASTGRSGSTM